MRSFDGVTAGVGGAIRLNIVVEWKLSFLTLLCRSGSFGGSGDGACLPLPVPLPMRGLRGKLKRLSTLGAIEARLREHESFVAQLPRLSTWQARARRA